jgi:hypothetical protein
MRICIKGTAECSMSRGPRTDTYCKVQGPDSERHSISDRTVNAGALLIAQIHGYLLGLKSIKTLIVGLQKNLNLLAINSKILIINLH